MGRVVWREGHVLSMETRTGIFALAQMSREPYMIFFEAFSTNDTWDEVDLATTPVLFCKAVTRQFLKFSNVTKHPQIQSLEITALPTQWIHQMSDSRQVRVWPDTPNEKEFITLGDGGALVEKDVLHHQGGPYAHPSGVFDRVLIKRIDPSDDNTIEAHELDTIGIFPALNERLYLCYHFGRSLDPDKDILFDRDLPLDYTTYVTLVGGDAEEVQTIADLYEFAAR